MILSGGFEVCKSCDRHCTSATPGYPFLIKALPFMTHILLLIPTVDQEKERGGGYVEQ